MNAVPKLSVVIACGEAGKSLWRCLSAIEKSCEHVDAEIILVSPAGVRVELPPVTEASKLVAIRLQDAALVPELWAAGYRASRAGVVAFTTERCIVNPDWAEALLDAIAGGATGAGGPIELASSTTSLDAAVYLLRYSAFMPPMTTKRLAEIAGDNAAYDRSALDRHSSSFGDGFWEVDFHRRIRAEGGYLMAVPAATVAFTGSHSLRGMLRQRYQHGKQSGAMRTRSGGIPIWRSLVAAPLVPGVLAARVLGRSLKRRVYVGRTLVALPVLYSLACAWAAGEVAGVLRAWNGRHLHEGNVSRV